MSYNRFEGSVMLNTFRSTHVMGRGIAAAAISAALVFSAVPVAAYADTSDDLQAAQAKLTELQAQSDDATHQLELNQADLADTETAIDDLQGKIEQTEADLADAKSDLSSTVHAAYKNDSSFLSIILGSSTLDEFVSNIYYANKVADTQASQVQTVKDLETQYDQQKSELEAKKVEQQNLVSEQQNKVAAIESAQSEQQSYVNSLSDQLQAELEAAQKAAEEAAAQEAQANIDAEVASGDVVANAGDVQQASDDQPASSDNGTTATTSDSGDNGSSQVTTDNGSQAQTTNTTQNNQSAQTNNSSNSGSSSNTNTSSNTSANTNTRTNTNSGSSTRTNTSSNTSTKTNTSSNTAKGNTSTNKSYSSSGKQAVVAAAMTKLGCSYVWGSAGPDTFDCSGLVSWAYAQAGYSVGRGTSSSFYQKALASGTFTTNPNNLAVGDPVFYASGGSIYHIAIYAGGGQVVHANGYGSGVVVTSVYYDSGFVGGGSIV